MTYISKLSNFTKFRMLSCCNSLAWALYSFKVMPLLFLCGTKRIQQYTETCLLVCTSFARLQTSSVQVEIYECLQSKRQKPPGTRLNIFLSNAGFIYRKASLHLLVFSNFDQIRKNLFHKHFIIHKNWFQLII